MTPFFRALTCSRTAARLEAGKMLGRGDACRSSLPRRDMLRARRVTWNEKDFPGEVLDPFGTEVHTSGELVLSQLMLEKLTALAALKPYARALGTAVVRRDGVGGFFWTGVACRRPRHIFATSSRFSRAAPSRASWQVRDTAPPG